MLNYKEIKNKPSNHIEMMYVNAINDLGWLKWRSPFYKNFDDSKLQIIYEFGLKHKAYSGRMNIDSNRIEYTFRFDTYFKLEYIEWDEHSMLMTVTDSRDGSLEICSNNLDTFHKEYSGMVKNQEDLKYPKLLETLQQQLWDVCRISEKYDDAILKRLYDFSVSLDYNKFKTYVSFNNHVRLVAYSSSKQVIWFTINEHDLISVSYFIKDQEESHMELYNASVEQLIEYITQRESNFD
jgi:hypothetical protein